MTARLRRVGVLGGMGPAATILLQQRLVAAVGAEDDASHLPLLIDMNPQVPSRIAWLIEGRGDDPEPVLARMARGLAAGGAEALAMPCNTAHHFAPAIAEAVDIPLIDMIELASARLAAALPGGGPVGVLASPALERIALLDDPLARRAMAPLHPPDPDALLGAIRRIKAHGVGAEDRAALVDAARALRDLGAGALLVACSEFSLATDAVVDALGAEIPVVDALDALVNGIVAFAGAASSDRG